MQWSKLKAKLKDLIAPELRDRVDFHLTRFRAAHDQVGRAWVTIDGNEILDCSHGRWFQAYVKTRLELIEKTGPKRGRADTLKLSSQAMQEVKTQQIFSEKDFIASLTRYLDYSIKEALASTDPFVRAFALIDRRVGKRSFEKLRIDEVEHPLVQVFYKLRLESLEGEKFNAN